MGFKVNKNAFSDFENALNIALETAVVDITGAIQKHLVPRSPNQPSPKNPLAPVTGNLRDAVTREKAGNLKYRVGVDATRQTQTFRENGMEIKRPKPVDYGEHLEFGTRYMKPRSYLRRGSIEFKDRFFTVLQKEFQIQFGKK